MYAIIQAGGRQVRVEPGTVVTVDRLDQPPGTEVTFDRVLFVEKDGGAFVAGAPYVTGARVVGTVASEVRDAKIQVFMKKRRKGMRRRIGHRSTRTRVNIKEIVAG